jgi:hypothetical protein
MIFSTKKINGIQNKYKQEDLLNFLRNNYTSGKYKLCLEKIRENKQYLTKFAPKKLFIYSLIELHLLGKLGLKEEALEMINNQYAMSDLDINLFARLSLNFKCSSPLTFFQNIFEQLYKLTHAHADKNIDSKYIDEEASKLPTEPTMSPIEQLSHFVFYKKYYLENDTFYDETLPILYNFPKDETTKDALFEFMGLYILELTTNTQRDQGPETRNHSIIFTEASLMDYYWRKGNQEMLIKIGFDFTKYTLPEMYKHIDIFLTARYNFLIALSKKYHGQTNDPDLFYFVVNSTRELFPDIVAQYYESNDLSIENSSNSSM